MNHLKCSHKIYQHINPLEPYEDTRWQEKKHHYSAVALSVTVGKKHFNSVMCRDGGSQHIVLQVCVHYASRNS